MEGTPLPVVLITGASTGLGLSLSKQLATRSRYHLVLSARESSLSRFAEARIEKSARLWIRPLDVTNHKERRLLLSEVEKRLGGVDILINNAAIAYRSVVEQVSHEESFLQMNVNFFGPMALIREVLPRMRAKRSGRIINISSVGGMMAMPTMAIYSASKFALEGATESLYYEARPWGVHVSLVEPGFVNSSSFENTLYTELGRRAAEDPSDPYHEYYQSMSPFIARMMRRSPATPADVARAIVKTMEHSNPPLRVPATPDAYLFDLLRRLLPRRFYHWMLYRSLPNISRWGR